MTAMSSKYFKNNNNTVTQARQTSSTSGSIFTAPTQISEVFSKQQLKCICRLKTRQSKSETEK